MKIENIIVHVKIWVIRLTLRNGVNMPTVQSEYVWSKVKESHKGVHWPYRYVSF